MNKYLEKISGFTGQSLEHLTKRLGQLNRGVKNFASTSELPAIDRMLRGVKAEKRQLRVHNEILDRILKDTKG